MKSSISQINIELNSKYDNAIEAAKNNNFCIVYDAARPLLNWLSNFFLIPKRWRNIINGLLLVCDNLCNQNQN